MDEKIFGENEEEPEDQWVDNTRAGIAVELNIHFMDLEIIAHCH